MTISVITLINGRVQMVQMTEAINVCKGGAEALNFDAMKFDVEVGPLKDRDDNEISSTIRRGIYNKDTGDIIRQIPATWDANMVDSQELLFYSNYDKDN